MYRVAPDNTELEYTCIAVFFSFCWIEGCFITSAVLLLHNASFNILANLTEIRNKMKNKKKLKKRKTMSKYDNDSLRQS
jgi:hypothetical protein